MILYHWTYQKCLESILREGLKPKTELGIVYLSPTKKKPGFGRYEVLLKVETGDNKLTAFDDCREWETLCWGSIPSENIKVLETAPVNLNDPNVG